MSLVLPPKVSGKTQAVLQVGCDLVQFNSLRPEGPIGIYLLWWGQDISQQICLSPPILYSETDNVSSIVKMRNGYISVKLYW